MDKLKPQPCRRFIVPKGDLSYRQATQLHPQDSILLTAAMYQYGSGIEARRLPKDAVFSDRLDPLVEHGLYGPETLWNKFWSYISSVQEMPPSDWEIVGKDLLGFLETEVTLDTEFARISILSIFSKNEHIDHFAKLAQRFSAGDGHTRREILLAAKTNSRADWLREHKEDYSSMDPWQRMAFTYCMSVLPKDERRFSLKRHKYDSLFEEHLAKWSIG